jgi:hypothetical protein
MLKAERILMVDLTATQAQTKGSAPSTEREGGQTKAVGTKPLNALPPPSADGVERLYRQLVEVHAIAAMQLVECTHWCQSYPTSRLVHARAGW